jgi:hypothetical protein
VVAQETNVDGIIHVTMIRASPTACIINLEIGALNAIQRSNKHRKERL